MSRRLELGLADKLPLGKMTGQLWQTHEPDLPGGHVSPLCPTEGGSAHVVVSWLLQRLPQSLRHQPRFPPNHDVRCGRTGVSLSR